MSARIEGVPQGSPLSPLLSNIVLDALDKELENRGHSFVRYADDVSIYVRSERAARRVKETVSEYVENDLKLKINREKSEINQGEQSSLLGFTFSRSDGKWEIRISPKAQRRIKEKIRKVTQRKDPSKTRDKIKKMESLIVGWVNYFRIAKAGWLMGRLDGMVRHRLRMGIWKQWKTPRNRAKNLKKLGVPPDVLYRWGKGSSGYCRIANSQLLKMGLNNSVLRKAGYVGFYQHYYWKTQHQINLF